MRKTERGQREIEHGKFLASGNAEAIWGWATVAGKVRAKRRADLIMKAGNLDAETTVLEIGCGTGNFTQIFAKSSAKIRAIDISADLLGFAKQLDLPDEQIEFECIRFEEMREQLFFDAIIGSSVLHHLEVIPALKNIYRMLKPGGWLAFAEPIMLNPQVFAERTFLRSLLPYVSPDETAFVRWSIARELSDVGFRNIRITPFDWLHPIVPAKLIRTVSGIGRILEQIPIIREFSGSIIIQAQKLIVSQCERKG